MKARRLALAACLSIACLRAELQLFVLGAAGEQPVGQVYTIGTVASSDVLDTRFRVRNTGAEPARLAAMSVAGAGFSLRHAPEALEWVLPGDALEFTVHFEPGGTGIFSAVLRAGAVQTLLRATAFAAATVYVEEQGERRLLRAGAQVEFGSIERLSRAERRFIFENRTEQVLANPGVTVAGSAFRMPDPAPRDIAPGEAAWVRIVFAPQAAGSYTGQLAVDQRRIALRGSGLEIPLPRPEIVLDLQGRPASSALQAKLWIRLSPAARLSASGKLAMEFRPAIPGAADPAIVFATGGRSMGFSVSDGDDAARFVSGSAASFQTGTTAGTMVFTAELGEHQDVASLVIPPEPVGLDSITVARTSAGLEVQVTGFDNTRSVSQVSFTFYDRAGAIVPPGTFRVDQTAEFRKYFETSEVGGAFALRAAFPVTGGAESIAGLEVEMTNSAGTARSQRVRF